MFLHDIFPPEFIKIGLEAEDKDEVFEELVDKFCQIKKTNDREEILEALWDRESKMSTGIQKGVAIPHGKSGTLENVHGVLGISRKGIEYDALDGQPVYILFMILVPKADSEEHLRILKRLSELLDNHQFYTELLAQNDPQGASRIIKKYEDIYIASD
ncbi:MAG: PTS sugar transporter subunit IIA [Treponema sp.]|jgi:PTS system fructose-specific IIC component/PTS system nitrogen regulatory IIA component|nr:PTS sugar transporter subunit IIA [Treponema sp.]